MIFQCQHCFKRLTQHSTAMKKPFRMGGRFIPTIVYYSRRSLRRRETKKMDPIIAVIIAVAAFIVGAAAAGFICFKMGVKHRIKTAEAQFESAEKESARIIEEANVKAEDRKGDQPLKGRNRPRAEGTPRGALPFRAPSPAERGKPRQENRQNGAL